MSFKTNDKIVKCFSECGFNDIQFAFAYGEENIQFMLNQKCITIEKYENSTEKDEYGCLYKNDDKLEHENEHLIEYGNDFIKNCKIIHDRD